MDSSPDSVDPSLAEAVVRLCEPVFAAADVGFTHQVSYERETGRVTAILWEAEPRAFAARFPESGVEESYGEKQWPDVTCIDFWAYAEGRDRLRISVEGWDLPQMSVPLGHVVDPYCVRSLFARILGKSPPIGDD